MEDVSGSILKSIREFSDELVISPEEFMDITKEIPIIKYIGIVYKTGGFLNEMYFKRKVLSFLNELSSIDQRKIDSFFNEKSENDKEFGLKLLRVIEKIDDEQISIYFTKWFKCYVLGNITKEQFNRGSIIIQRIYISDFEQFLKSSLVDLEITGSTEDYPHEEMFPLIHNGLLGYGNNTPKITTRYDETEVESSVTIWITEIGKIMRKNLS